MVVSSLATVGRTVARYICVRVSGCGLDLMTLISDVHVIITLNLL